MNSLIVVGHYRKREITFHEKRLRMRASTPFKRKSVRQNFYRTLIENMIQDGDEANYSPNHGFVFLRRKG